MRVIKPVIVSDSNLTSSTIPEPDSGEIEWTAGTYNLGERRIKSSTHRIYEVTADPSTNDDPTGANQGVNATPPTWVDVGPTNRWSMFDNVNSTKSLETTQLIVEITAGQITNSIAGFSIDGANDINITVTDPVDGVVYSKDIEMNDNSSVADWYYYYFSPIIKRSSFTLLDLPAYPAATVKMTVDGNDIGFGNFVIGNSLELGVANYNSNLQLLDFSRKETDIFGNTVVTTGRTSKLVTYDVTIQKDRIGYVFDVISSITSIPAVWVGTDDTDDVTAVFGYYRDYQNNISSPTITDATITVEGLV